MKEFLKPRIIFLTSALIVFFASLNGLIGVGFGSGFGERTVATAYSVFLLCTISWVCFRLANMRENDNFDETRDARFFWRFVGCAFAYLALDDAIQVHEALDRIIHIVFGFPETAWTDRIDDMIVLAYGLAGIAVLVKYRKVLLSSQIQTSFLLLASLFFFITVAFDVLSNRDEYLDWLDIQGQLRLSVKFWIEFLEEGGKIFAAASILAAFAKGLHPSAMKSPAY